MSRLLAYLWLHLIPILVIAGAIMCVTGATALTGILVALLLGPWAGLAAAATVLGGLTTWAALRASQLTVIEEGNP